MKSLKTAGALLMWAFFLSACKTPVTCKLYNNTASSVEVVRSQEDHQLSQEVPPGSVVELSEWIWGTYEIRSSGRIWRYDVREPSLEFQKTKGLVLRERVFRAQLQADGQVFVLGLDQSPPAANFPEQPEGFPLRPTSP